MLISFLFMFVRMPSIKAMQQSQSQCKQSGQWNSEVNCNYEDLHMYLKLASVAYSRSSCFQRLFTLIESLKLFSIIRISILSQSISMALFSCSAYFNSRSPYHLPNLNTHNLQYIIHLYCWDSLIGVFSWKFQLEQLMHAGTGLTLLTVYTQYLQFSQSNECNAIPIPIESV